MDKQNEKHDDIYTFGDSLTENVSNSSLQKSLIDLEERLDDRIRVLFKYKTAQITLKIIVFTSIACLMFVRSGRHHDIYLWFIGIFMTLVALSELFELEEFRFYTKESRKVSEKNQDNK